ncbi:hypothetical protein GGI07_003738 [Coemansia sp. Benny D115]|nr:hypothetical protein GGI07_003738 [Coemansia sp. Benny D115]
MSDSDKPAKVLVAGSVNGGLAAFFTKVTKLDAKYGPFSALLVSGNLFAASDGDSEDVDAILDNKIAVPIMTYVVSGDRALPPRIRERAALRSGEICHNLVLLRGQGILQTSEGIKIAYVGGRFTSESSKPEHRTQAEADDAQENEPPQDAGAADAQPTTEDTEADGDEQHNNGNNGSTFDHAAMADLITQVAAENEKVFRKTQSQPSIDILLTYDWPYGAVCKEQQIDQGIVTKSACNKVSYLNSVIMPRYHFASSEGLFYERLPWKCGGRIKIGRSAAESELHFTRFVGLGSVNSTEHDKQRWFYAMNLSPLQWASSGKVQPSKPPANCTANPMYQFSKMGSPLDSKSLSRAISNIGASGDAGGSGELKGAPEKRQPPPLSYTCHICNQPGHWISDCPSKDQSKKRRVEKAPPEGYICRKCKQAGHWVSDCPAGSVPDAAATADMLAKCWFCLANPDIDQNLMVAIGDEAYVALSKGSIVLGGNDRSRFEGHFSPIPGGGHILIVPIVHTDSIQRAREGDSDADRSLCAEIDRWTDAAAALFAEYDCVPLAFETCRYMPHVHTSIQLVPIPRTRAASFMDIFKEVCLEENVEPLSRCPERTTGGYFSVSNLAPTSDDDKQLFVQIKKKASFNLQFGRKLAARLLGIPKREDWRACVIPEESEASERDRFIAVFSAHDFTR